MKTQEEEKLKDLFINYLKEALNENYFNVGEDIKAKNGRNDFDYLLKSDVGKTIALEITSVRKRSLNERSSKLPLFEVFFNKLLNNGNGLPSIIFTILEPKVIKKQGVVELSEIK